MSKKLWTQEEIAILKDLYYNNEPLENIANKLDRTKKAVARKASELKISRSIMDKHNNKYKAPYQDYNWCYERYINRSMTHEQMAKEANTTLRTIQKWCSEKHGLNARTFKKYKKLSDIQRQLIMFSLLGDGHIDKRENEPLFIVSHAENQKDYLYWKHDILIDLCSSEPTYYPEGTAIFNGKEYKRNGAYRFCTRVINDLIPIREMSKYEIIDKLNEFGLSIHMLDDAYRSRSNWDICVASFTDKEKNLYINICQERFGLSCKLMNDNRYIEFDALSSRKIDDIILSNIPNDLDVVQYKITDNDICEPANYFYVIVDNEKIGLRRYCNIAKLPYMKIKDITNAFDVFEMPEEEIIKILKEKGVINNEGV